MENNIKVSVRNLVEFVLSCGDLNVSFTGTSRNTDAIKAHQKIQKAQGEEYTKEVPLSIVINKNGFNIEVSGRADGIIKSSDSITIDEIKTTTSELNSIDEDYNILHWAQAECYAYIYAVQNAISDINVQLTYYNLNTAELKRFKKNFSKLDLEGIFFNLIDKYLIWAQDTYDWNAARNLSIKSLEFPFGNYRIGQRRMAVDIYRTIRDGKRILIEAPTGTGKTIAALYPAVKSLGEGHVSKLFYLTAKTITRTAAEDAFSKLRSNGLRIRTVVLTAKDKVCLKPEANCSAEECEFAKGYYDRVKDALKNILDIECINKEIIENYAKEYKLCPFEFSLEITNFCDAIICDYNYVFDPRVYLKNFFLEGKEDYAFLIDEAHNLVDRAREMFSAELSKDKVLEVKKNIKLYSKGIYKSLDKINKYMIEEKKKCAADLSNIAKEAPKDLFPLLHSYINCCEKWLIENQNNQYKDEILELYFDIFSFLRTSEFYDERYVTYSYIDSRSMKLKLFCLNPSYLLNEVLKRGKAAVFFSATLSPMDYYSYILGNDDTCRKIKLPSPFPKNNLHVMLNKRISTLYKTRKNSYDDIANSIAYMIKARKGNYFAFFPSYEYMEAVFQIFSSKNSDVEIIKQEFNMNEEEREDFIANFKRTKDETLIAFAVMGGMFGEGIDLAGDMLSGAIIVGVGLPKICIERNIIMNYFNELNGMGFEFAYIYPGINKVMQAAGRVIRTEYDRGIVFLIDNRFMQNQYRKLLNTNWFPLAIVETPRAAGEEAYKFWTESNSNKIHPI